MNRRITNKANLPQALVRALENDTYSKGDADFSTTELIQPPRITALKAIHKDEITEDASDLIYSLIGQLGHSILERSGTADMVEKRLFHTLPDGTKISGCLDIVDGDMIEDWKFTSIWTAYQGVKEDWKLQASINSYLCEKNGITIKGARYIAIYRDWSKPKAFRDSSYPQTQVQVFDVPLMDLLETEDWIINRVRMHKEARLNLPECSAEDRWCRDEKWAVMKSGRKTALKLCDSPIEAQDFISNSQDHKQLSVEHRQGVNTRCEFYCMVSEFCEQFKNLKSTAFLVNEANRETP